MVKQAFSFCFTLNNWTFDDVAWILDTIENDNWEFDNPMFDYICWGFEKGKQGTQHLQGYIHFYHKKTLKSCIDYFKEMLTHARTHIEIAKGSPKQAITYCEKDKDFFEWGRRPAQGSTTMDKIESAMKDPASDPHTYNQYRKVYKDIQVAKAKQERKVRLLRMIHCEDMYDIADSSEGTVFMGSDPETYDGEEVVFLDGYTNMDNVKKWYRGYPNKIRRGYELIEFIPTTVYLTYSDQKSRAYIEKIYLPMLDGDWQKDYTETQN